MKFLHEKKYLFNLIIFPLKSCFEIIKIIKIEKKIKINFLKENNE